MAKGMPAVTPEQLEAMLARSLKVTGAVIDGKSQHVIFTAQQSELEITQTIVAVDFASILSLGGALLGVLYPPGRPAKVVGASQIPQGGTS